MSLSKNTSAKRLGRNTLMLVVGSSHRVTRIIGPYWVVCRTALGGNACPRLVYRAMRCCQPHVRKRPQIVWRTGARVLLGPGNRMKRHTLTYSGCGTASPGFDSSDDGSIICKRNPSVLLPEQTTTYITTCTACVSYRYRTKELRVPITSTVRDTQQQQHTSCF